MKPSQLHQLFLYDPATGVIRNKVNRGPRAPTGTVAGSINGHGYRYIQINGEMIPAHRIIYAMMTGRWPRYCMDHINRDPGDNRWCNLRHVSHAGNMRNKSIYSNNRTGHTGVRRLPSGSFIASITTGGVTRYLGTEPTIEGAVALRKQAEQRLGFCV